MGFRVDCTLLVWLRADFDLHNYTHLLIYAKTEVSEQTVPTFHVIKDEVVPRRGPKSRSMFDGAVFLNCLTNRNPFLRSQEV